MKSVVSRGIRGRHWLLLLLLLAAVDVGAQAPAVGQMRIMFTEDGGPAATVVTGTLYFEAPGMGSRQRSISVFNTPLEVGAMPAGTYRVTVVAQSATRVLVSSRVHEIQITAAHPTVALVVDLIHRDGAALVVDASGTPVAGAHFYTSPSAVNSTADDEGRINLSTIASGTALTVRTIQWGVTCHKVTDAEAQTIVVPDAAEPLVIVTPSAPTSTLPQRRHIVPSPLLTGAMVSGIHGADCAVPYEHLPVTLAKAGGTTEHTLLLPFGDYTIRLLDGTTLTASAPGRVELR